MSFGEPSKDFHEWTLNQEETTKVIKRAFELGVNFLIQLTFIHMEQAKYL